MKTCGSWLASDEALADKAALPDPTPSLASQLPQGFAVFCVCPTRLTADVDATIISDSEPLTLSAVYPQHRQASRPVQVLVEFLRERLDEANGVI